MAVDAKRTNRPTTIGGIVVYDVWGVMGVPRMAYGGCLLSSSGHGLRPERFAVLIFF